MQWISFAVLFKRIKAIKSFLKDPDVPKRRKLLIIGGLIYLIAPIDIAPDPIFLVGFLDDLLLWAFILFYLKDQLDKYWKEEGEGFDPKENFEGKDIIETDEFQVDEEDKKR